MISPESVHLGLEREIRALSRLGIEGIEAEVRAFDIVRAKIRNSEAMTETQHDISRCLVCGTSIDDTEAVIVVLTGKLGHHHHLHARCHPEHVRKIDERVNEVMREAGYAP